MMRQTPRTFVGSVVLLLDGPIDPLAARRARDRVAELPGVRSCDLDPGSGSLVVTAVQPVDRSDVLDVVGECGCRVRD